MNNYDNYRERDRDRDRDRDKDRDKEGNSIIKFKKKCVFCKNKDIVINYKNLDLLTKYVSSKGKIISRRISGNCAKHQRKLTQEIKRVRFLSLIPYVVN